jgi:hypothetical protein
MLGLKLSLTDTCSDDVDSAALRLKYLCLLGPGPTRLRRATGALTLAIVPAPHCGSVQ